MRSGFVAIVGRPNAGKSTLLNTILGTKVSIVTPKAQTTRERVLGILTEELGQVVFVDTPGIHRAREGGLNAYMVHEAREALEAPTIVWYIVDPASALEHEKLVLELLSASRVPVVLLINKVDTYKNIPAIEKLEKELQAALAERKIPVLKTLRISARKRAGLNELVKLTWDSLPEGPMYYPDAEQVSDRPVRFFVAEKIREQLLLNLGEELPYSCAVEIEQFQEPEAPGDITRIEAVIHVERDSQKGMVIGKGGRKIKEIGQAARGEIEDFIGGKAFLGLRVKVLKDWTRDKEALRRMGYNVPAEKAKGRGK